ncbi:MAG: cell division suppressor protein YneA [Priestia megaterium]|uniref:cell division suppressor protein YneA n=1 Tax=Priestia megaterium TaxID=1404 RepID=UPI0006800DC5|nr:cell division suppressor protein YneA [Priestia megaterium]AUO10829.1 cell division suppressor protein YneA [Priestia megaterium]KNH22590.1 cell division protein [Priestia megaterium]PVE72824.1 cell division suppressor protein YneA [Priestia megaterium]PVE89613.1 cell division suppressor protein YneA [Priestia megaterium]PVE90741.1 cell division suppressor protein YneA [Priestia megaterium]
MQQFLHSMKHYAVFFAVIAALTYVLTLVLGADKVDLDKYSTVTITKGDTLWELSNKYHNHHHLTTNEFVKWVEDVNDLNSDTAQSLSPGDKLYIPVLKKELHNQVAIEQ